MANLFDFDNYKGFLKALIAENGAQRGYQSSLARAAHCQPSYMSQVLTGKADLLPDQALRIAEWLGFTETESEFLLTLVLLGRAASPPLKRHLEGKLRQLRQTQQRIDKRIGSTQPVSLEVEKFYYSSWIWTAIHIATSVPGLQTVKAISERLGLPQSRVKSCLERLQQAGLVAQKEGKWQYAGGATHLSRESTMSELNHAHWRQRSMLDVQKDEDQSLHYTSVVSLSEADVSRLTEFLIRMIAESRKISDPSPPEEVCCLTLDFFRI